MATISDPDPGLSEEPEDTSLDRRERKRRFAGRAKKKAKSRRRGSRQRVTMVTISDREETKKRRFALWFHITVIVSIGLLSILLISLRFSSVMLTEEEEEAPSITEFHSSTHVLPVGQTARYTCHASGTPEPTVEWLHNGRPLERDGTDDQSEAWVERGFLFIRGGRYGVNTVCCMASNSAGTANHSAELLVFDACDLTLDPNTANGDLSLSEDNRKVTGVEEDQSYPDHPDRFDSWSQVLGREALTGRCYWEVEWEGGVGIGVTYRGITRRGAGYDSLLGRNNKSWTLHCSDDHYSARYNRTETALPLRPAGSTRVGVYLDRPAGSLSFYRVSPGGGGSSDTLTHLHTFWSSFTQEDLLPGVAVGGKWTPGGVLEGSSASLCRL
uniref:B30.2/SPRY domain-containing protein n=1 Tax=Gadus morhua TaxID=8049 RepID=A0A8C5B196_GADMO